MDNSDYLEKLVNIKQKSSKKFKIKSENITWKRKNYLKTE